MRAAERMAASMEAIITWGDARADIETRRIEAESGGIAWPRITAGAIGGNPIGTGRRIIRHASNNENRPDRRPAAGRRHHAVSAECADARTDYRHARPAGMAAPER